MKGKRIMGMTITTGNLSSIPNSINVGKPTITVDFSDVNETVKKTGIKYRAHHDTGDVSRDELNKRMDLAAIKSTQQLPDKTEEKGGGDCDDLAIYYAEKMQNNNSECFREYGIVTGYDQTRDGYSAHSKLYVRDLRTPKRYELYEVTSPEKGPKYSGSYNMLNENTVKSAPKIGDFYLNHAAPMKSGKPDYSEVKWFVPE